MKPAYNEPVRRLRALVDGKISHRMVTREAAAAETLLDLVFRITMLAAP